MQKGIMRIAFKAFIFFIIMPINGFLVIGGIVENEPWVVFWGMLSAILQVPLFIEENFYERRA